VLRSGDCRSGFGCRWWHASSELVGVGDELDPPRLAERANERTREIVDALGAPSVDVLEGPCLLPGWSRLTIACHLRYGAVASRRMTIDALAGRPTSFYPEGRRQQRPGTLVPGAGEDAEATVVSLDAESRLLHEGWASLSPTDWATTIVEGGGPVDLGTITVGVLVLFRLTEVEVHGVDLDLGLADWSDLFVDQALAFRLGWLARRRSNHRAVEAGVEGTWLLTASDGPSWRVTVSGQTVDSRPVPPGTEADAVIAGSSRDLLALLLGRPARRPLRTAGNRALAAAFGRAFPGP
jgi:uncharacterized protein (TIGR03083 family)